MQQLQDSPAFTKPEYLIDREELLRLKEVKLLDNKSYIFFALKLSYTSTNPSVDIESFCEQWDIKESDFSIAIAQLQKKGLLEPEARQLKLQLF